MEYGEIYFMSVQHEPQAVKIKHIVKCFAIFHSDSEKPPLLSLSMDYIHNYFLGHYWHFSVTLQFVP